MKDTYNPAVAAINNPEEVTVAMSTRLERPDSPDSSSELVTDCAVVVSIEKH